MNVLVFKDGKRVGKIKLSEEGLIPTFLRYGYQLRAERSLGVRGAVEVRGSRVTRKAKDKVAS